ncbi:hypothetical protein Golax_020624, partial [Gossypium laxum]|nr:hypothetical protein [Gossypium laxum]
DLEAIRIILEKKGNLTKERDEDGHIPLHYAAHLGKVMVEQVQRFSLYVQIVAKKWTTKKQIKDLLEEIENDQVAQEPVRHFHLPNVSIERLEAIRNTHLIVAALIATVTFAAAITVPGGLESEKGSKQGNPFLIHEAAFKAFVVTNALAFIFSVSACWDLENDR